VGSMSDERFMRLAIEKAREGIRKGQTPFGACIVKDGQVISCAHNGVWETTDITAHAEVRAIRDACAKLGTIDLSGCTIYTTCEPCPMCFSACHWAKISRIVYGAGINDAKGAGFNELTLSGEEMKARGNSPVELTGKLLEEENRALFRLWSEQGCRMPY
jgi:guanine deaminase